RQELRRPNLKLGWRLALAAVGGTLGSTTLLWLGEASFRATVPWLLLFATLCFTAAPFIKNWLERHHGFDGREWLWLCFLLEFIVYAYGGYFGLGMGIILLAIYAMFGHEDIHEANALRNATITIVTII